MNWKVLAVIIAIVAFILFGGINLTKSGFNLAKTESIKLKTDISNFVAKNQLPKGTSPDKQASSM